MPDDNDIKKDFAVFQKETNTTLQKLMTQQAVLFEKLEAVVDQMTNFSENIKVLIGQHSIEIKELRETNQKLNYDNGYLHNNQTWIKVLGLAGMAVLGGILSTMEFQINRTGERIEDYNQQHVMIQNRIGAMEFSRGKNEKIN